LSTIFGSTTHGTNFRNFNGKISTVFKKTQKRGFFAVDWTIARERWKRLTLLVLHCSKHRHGRAALRRGLRVFTTTAGCRGCCRLNLSPRP